MEITSFCKTLYCEVAIFFINEWLNDMGISIGVGVNPITILTSGVLGFPGLLALYGIGFYKNL